MARVAPRLISTTKNSGVLAELRLSTRSGVKRYTLLENPAPGHYVFDSELGQPKFDSPSIPMLTEPALEKVIDYELPVDGQTFQVTALQMGNPNCCIFVDDFDALDWRQTRQGDRAA